MESTDETTHKPLASFCRSPLCYGLLGGLLYWAALPWAWSDVLTRTLWPLGWLAPVAWVVLVRREKLAESGKRKAESRKVEQSRVRRFFARPYVQLWLAGFIFWLATIHWLRLPHPATYLGWISLSFYLGFYLPLFVGVSRVAVHKLHVPAIIATPIVWTGLEYIRAYMITGFLMVTLGHTQYQWIALIQISDIFGGYGVSFLVMFVAACIARMLPVASRNADTTKRYALWPVVPAAIVIAATLGYGHWQLANVEKTAGPKIALIQGSIDSEMKQDATQSDTIYHEYEQLSFDALEQSPNVELIVWPETMYRFPTAEYPFLIWLDAGQQLPNEVHEEMRQTQLRDLRHTAAVMDKPLLLGVSTVLPPRSPGETERRYNSAVFVERDGTLAGRYDKMHRVLFGEYIPFMDLIPELKSLTPLGQNGTIAAGEQAVAIEVGDAQISPSICYETVLPQVIRRQVYDLTFVRSEHAPDILVNVTNDGWFWGSSQLDQHLVCGVFRAVEMRKPLLIAANTGFSASIDSDGRIIAQGPRRDTGFIIAEPQIDSRTSLYLLLGDWFPALCLLLSSFVALVGVAGWLRSGTRGKL